MSNISGDPAAPRRHFRLVNPAQLSPRRAGEIYAIIRQALQGGYARSGNATAASYQGWRRMNTAPYLSATHGNHYLNNYVNEIGAAAYGRFEKAGKLPRGTIIAKDSLSMTRSGEILLGGLFVMEKMPDGFNYASGDWKYTLIQADGTLFGETKGTGSKRVEYCIACHLAVEHHDHLWFLPKAYRVPARN
ncbi:MAG: cytochrome P460 family protein [Betaproteobacteria bacterium]|nr:cytochrome P460 family protein [Betaproteobacteria bacterium]